LALDKKGLRINAEPHTPMMQQYLSELGAEVKVFRNDETAPDALEALEALEALAPSHIVLSPGPGTPDQAGITLAVIDRLVGKIPVLGVCLGHQSIGQAFGGKVVRARTVMHGKVSRIRHDGRGVFQDVPADFVATRITRWWSSARAFLNASR
jgi:anthranilate synthase/aminodeoxychorismate synthase-like glutamine amidotransferase